MRLEQKLVGESARQSAEMLRHLAQAFIVLWPTHWDPSNSTLPTSATAVLTFVSGEGSTLKGTESGHAA